MRDMSDRLRHLAPLPALLATAGFLLIAPPLAAEPADHLCPDVTAVVRGGDKRNVALACEAAAAAASTLRQCGISMDDPLMMRIVDVPPSQAGVHGYGCFDPTINVISIMSIEGCMSHLRSDESRAGIDALDYYRSVIVHEVSHNIIYRVAQLRDLTLPFLAHEYLAYALQLDALSAASRRVLVERFASRVAGGPAVPNELLLFMDPSVFAVSAWQHFRALGPRCEAIGRVLGGKVDFRQPYE